MGAIDRVQDLLTAASRYAVACVSNDLVLSPLTAQAECRAKEDLLLAARRLEPGAETAKERRDAARRRGEK